MKGLILLAALLLCMSANATLISYSYDNSIANPQGSHSAVGVFTVDDQKRGLALLGLVLTGLVLSGLFSRLRRLSSR